MSDLPGVLAGYGARPTANSVNFDGSTIVFSTIAGTLFNQGGFYKATPVGLITKLADSADLRPGSPTLMFTNFSDIDVDGGLVFGVANNTVYKFEADGSVTNIAGGAYVSAAGARMAYYSDKTTLSRWNDGVIQTVLVSGAIVDGKLVQQILAADGQGDDVAVLLKFTDNSYGIYIVFGPVSARPIITSEPLDFNALENSTASFFVGAAGQSPLSFQWRKNGSPITGATNASLVISNVQNSDVAGYAVVVNNNNGSVTSRVAQLTRTTPAVPIILSGPIAGTAYFGSNVTIAVSASGVTPLTYLWRKDGVPIPGVNTPTLSLTNLTGADRASYSVVVSNVNGSVTSGGVLLLINPVITLQPVSVTNSVGGTAAFTVAAAGVPPLTYQWRRLLPTFAVLTGQTNNTLTFANLSSTNAGTYNVFVNSAGNGAVVSGNATLTVISTNTPAAPSLQQPTIVGGQFQFKLPTQSGFNYRIESKVNFADANWALEQTIPGDGTTKTVSVGVAGPAKFVRVSVSP